MDIESIDKRILVYKRIATEEKLWVNRMKQMKKLEPDPFDISEKNLPIFLTQSAF